jgi:hypothetical protein
LTKPLPAVVSSLGQRQILVAFFISRQTLRLADE